MTVEVREGLLAAVQRQAALTREVICFYSGGKESAVALDLCVKHFDKVHPVFMFHTPGLRFQEAALEWCERRYGVKFLRVPHFDVGQMRTSGMYCRPEPSAPVYTINDLYAHARNTFGCRWIVAGERAADSLFRRGMIGKSGSEDAKRGRFYPLAWWSQAQVMAYLKTHQLKLSAECQYMGHSFRGFNFGADMQQIHDHFPGDYARIKEFWPMIDTVLFRERLRKAGPDQPAKPA